MALIRLQQAARELGVSYPTLKQWIYRGKIRSLKTAGGHHRIPRAEIDRLLFQKGSASAPRRAVAGRPQTRAAGGGASRPSDRRWVLETSGGSGLETVISGRNQLLGRIVGLKTVGLLTKVSLDVGGQVVTAIITRDACRDLRLEVGEAAAALIKATEVMIIRPPGTRKS